MSPDSLPFARPSANAVQTGPDGRAVAAVTALYEDNALGLVRLAHVMNR